ASGPSARTSASRTSRTAGCNPAACFARTVAHSILALKTGNRRRPRAGGSPFNRDRLAPLGTDKTSTGRGTNSPDPRDRRQSGFPSGALIEYVDHRCREAPMFYPVPAKSGPASAQSESVSAPAEPPITRRVPPQLRQWRTYPVTAAVALAALG